MKGECDISKMELNGLPYNELLEVATLLQGLCRELNDRETANQRINTEVHIQFANLKNENIALKKENEELKALYQKEVDKNLLKTKTTYGKSTEKLLSLINAADNKPEDFEDESQDEDTDGSGKSGRIVNFPGEKETDENKGKIPGTGKEGKKKNLGKSNLKRSIENLPREIQYILDVATLNTEYGEGNWRIAFWRQHISVERIPATYYAKYVYTPVISYGLEHMLDTVPFANLLLPHSYTSPSIIADILYRKFLLGIPFHRQAMDYSMSGLDLSKQVIIHWVNAIVPEFFERIRSHCLAYMIQHGYIQSDESFLQVNKDGERGAHKGYIWVHCTSELLDCHPVAVFYYESTRNTDHLRRLLGEFIGYITCDAYVSYKVYEDENENITVTGCFMHCRRYFAEALFVNDISSLSEEAIADLPETKILLLIRDIYITDNALKDMAPEERYNARQEKVKPRVDELFRHLRFLAESGTVFSERMNKAIQYALNQEEKLREFLNDGNIPLDNGKSERLIRAYSIGRANWLFADTLTGANVNAIMYSIVETTRANSADVRIYLQYLLEKIPAAMDKGTADSKEFLDGMMPWSSEYRVYEGAVKKSAMDSYRSLFPEPEKPRTPLKGIRKPDQIDPPVANSA